MARYQMEVQVTITRMPDPEPPPDPKAEMLKDPMQSQDKLIDLATKAFGGGTMVIPSMCRPPGMSMTRTAVVTAEGFVDLAKIFAAYDALTEQTECSHP